MHQQGREPVSRMARAGVTDRQSIGQRWLRLIYVKSTGELRTQHLFGVGLGALVVEAVTDLVTPPGSAKLKSSVH
jgi:hypothetical protein